MQKKGNNKGLSLIELIVSIAILAIVVLPLLTAFIVSLRTNAKAKEKLRAVEIARNFMEGMEATTVKDICTQLNYPGDKFDLSKNYDRRIFNSKEVLDNGSAFVKARMMEDFGNDVANKDKMVTGSIVRYNNGKYKFLAHEKYYFHVTNIPSELVRGSDTAKNYYAALITIDANTQQMQQVGHDEQKYNHFSVANMESIDTMYDALNSNVIITSKLLSDINLQQGLHMKEDDLKYLTRTLKVTIEHPNADSNKTKVTLNYSYVCKNYPVVDSYGNPVMDEFDDTKQKLMSFDFPTDEYKDDYTVVMYDNESLVSTTDSCLRNVYLFYQPWYESKSLDPMQMKDNIVIENPDNYDCTVKLIKQKWVNDDILGTSEQQYHVKVDVNEGIRSGTAHVKIETNLGTNILTENPDDPATQDQALYVYNGSRVTRIYNAAGKTAAAKGDKATSVLWVSTGFGMEEERNRIYDVRVDIYPNPTDANVQLDEIYANMFHGADTLKPIVTLTGGLAD